MGYFGRVGAELGVSAGTLRGWACRAQVDAGARAGAAVSDAERVRQFEAENRGLRGASAIGKSVSAFPAAELDRPTR